VFDGDTMVGVVDDEDILRVVVAEEEVSAEAPAHAAPEPTPASTPTVDVAEQGAAR